MALAEPVVELSAKSVIIAVNMIDRPLPKPPNPPISAQGMVISACVAVTSALVMGWTEPTLT